ncbi:MAG: hypothetical protein AB1861_12810 [Cyanobacteriota bacterium]
MFLLFIASQDCDSFYYGNNADAIAKMIPTKRLADALLVLPVA